MKSIPVVRPLAIAGVLVALFLAGCAAGGGTKPAESLADRAVARWNYLINKEPEKAWEYMTPGSRQVAPRDQYVRETLVKPVQWTGAEYESQECQSADACEVLVNVKFRVRSHLTGVGMLDAERRLVETWIRVDGQWYFLPKEQ